MATVRDKDQNAVNKKRARADAADAKPLPPPRSYNVLKRAKYTLHPAEQEANLAEDDLSTLRLFYVLQYSHPDGPPSVQTYVASDEDEVYRHIFEMHSYAFLGTEDCCSLGLLPKLQCGQHDRCELKELVGMTVGYSTKAALLVSKHFERVPIATVRRLVLEKRNGMAYRVERVDPIYVVTRSRIVTPEGYHHGQGDDVVAASPSMHARSTGTWTTDTRAPLDKPNTACGALTPTTRQLTPTTRQLTPRHVLPPLPGSTTPTAGATRQPTTPTGFAVSPGVYVSDKQSASNTAFPRQQRHVLPLLSGVITQTHTVTASDRWIN